MKHWTRITTIEGENMAFPTDRVNHVWEKPGEKLIAIRLNTGELYEVKTTLDAFMRGVSDQLKLERGPAIQENWVKRAFDTLTASEAVARGSQAKPSETVKERLEQAALHAWQEVCWRGERGGSEPARLTAFVRLPDSSGALKIAIQREQSSDCETL